VVKAEFLSKKAREYTDSQGRKRVAYTVNVVTEEGEAGGLLVSEETYAALSAKRGDVVVIRPALRVWQGRAELRIASVEVAKA
jgi:hypothetical protein